MSNLVKTIIKKSNLKIGMTVEWNGQLTTVDKENLKNTLHGMAFNGCSFPKEIVMVQFAVPTANGIVLR
tara:strand:+ start:26610 stop:26816 length:207 start_codon:yes stop_codon:yes gene_type:complete